MTSSGLNSGLGITVRCQIFYFSPWRSK